jgi:phytoene synthase
MDPYQHAADVVRERDRDRYLSDLFAPEQGRRHLFALHAFDAEVSRVRDVISDPMPGEIRLQWWRDAIENGEPGGNPLAEALIGTIREVPLPREALVNLLNARIFDLYNDPMPSLADLEGYAGETVSVVIQMGAMVLAGGSDPGSAEAAGHAGVAYGLAGLMLALPRHASRRQMFLPADVIAAQGLDTDDVFAGRTTEALRRVLADLRGVARRHLDAARAGMAGLDPALGPAFLPLALVEPRLRLMERAGYDPLAGVADLGPWRRQWTLWRAARRGLSD